MNYKLFTTLYDEAKEYENVELYVAERGWQDWMDAYTKKDEDASLISKILFSIFDLAKTDLRTQRENHNLSRAAFSKMYAVSSSTIQNWEYKNSNISQCMSMLVAYTFFIGDLKAENGHSLSFAKFGRNETNKV